MNIPSEYLKCVVFSTTLVLWFCVVLGVLKQRKRELAEIEKDVQEQKAREKEFKVKCAEFEESMKKLRESVQELERNGHDYYC